MSDTRKGSLSCQVTIQKTTVKEPLMRCRNRSIIAFEMCPDNVLITDISLRVMKYLKTEKNIDLRISN